MCDFEHSSKKKKFKYYGKSDVGLKMNTGIREANTRRVHESDCFVFCF